MCLTRFLACLGPTEVVKVAGVLLAAGSGSRFAGPSHKLLAGIGGEAVVTHAARSMVNSGLSGYLLVAGATELSSALTEFSELVIVENPESEHGIATSLSVAGDWGEAVGFDALIVGLADQPGVLSSSWRRLSNSNAPIAVANYDGLAGNPVRLEKSVWPLLPRSGDEGARVLLRTRPELVEQVACEGSPDDIDTVEDLGQWS